MDETILKLIQWLDMFVELEVPTVGPHTLIRRQEFNVILRPIQTTLTKSDLIWLQKALLLERSSSTFVQRVTMRPVLLSIQYIMSYLDLCELLQFLSSSLHFPIFIVFHLAFSIWSPESCAQADLTLNRSTKPRVKMNLPLS